MSLHVTECEMMLMDGRAAGLTSIKALVGTSCLHDRQLASLHGAGNRSPMRFGGGARTWGSRRVSWPTHQSELGGGRARWRLAACARRRLLMRCGDLPCEAETSCERQRLVERGGDFSCEAETSRGDPSCRELVGDATNWSET
jgi:hypothetical protein